ncbi:Mu transposase C-terminal domain-containing protein [Anaerobacillus sp. HL2]|nr:Mu transposase C-terminal domain-containing protein [Anaerobacillus sp. HL2]
MVISRDKVTITEKGIKFKGMYYSCETALRESWFETSRIKGSWKVDISYDSRNITNIYLINSSNGNYESCSLLPILNDIRIVHLKRLYICKKLRSR